MHSEQTANREIQQNQRTEMREGGGTVDAE